MDTRNLRRLFRSIRQESVLEGGYELVDGFGEQIRITRSALGWSQAHLAEQASISPSVISCIEVGKHKNPRISTLWRIATALGVSLADLLRIESLGTVDK